FYLKKNDKNDKMVFFIITKKLRLDMSIINYIKFPVGAIVGLDFYKNRQKNFFSKEPSKVFSVYPENNVNKTEMSACTYMNGICNSEQLAMKNAEKLADKTGCKVTVIHNPSTGSLIYDVSRAMMRLKSPMYRNRTQDLVSETLANELISQIEMKEQAFFERFGQKEDIKSYPDYYYIKHYAHSEGGIVTQSAINKLPEMLKKRVVFYAFGSPYIADENLPNRIDVVNKKDIVLHLGGHKPRHLRKPHNVIEKTPNKNYSGTFNLTEHSFDQYVDAKTIRQCEEVFKGVVVCDREKNEAAQEVSENS
ncbi:MAG: hypothetical protein AAF443_00605, partial [Chlamydiota bacterium]